MKMNDADRFSWLAAHSYSFQLGINSARLKYINKGGIEQKVDFNYEGEIPEDIEILRILVDKAQGIT